MGSLLGSVLLFWIGQHFDAIFFDDRVGQDLAGDRGHQRVRRLGRQLGSQLHFEQFALPYRLNPGIALPLQHRLDGLALGIEYGRLQVHCDSSFHNECSNYNIAIAGPNWHCGSHASNNPGRKNCLDFPQTSIHYGEQVLS